MREGGNQKPRNEDDGMSFYIHIPQASRTIGWELLDVRRSGMV